MKTGRQSFSSSRLVRRRQVFLSTDYPSTNNHVDGFSDEEILRKPSTSTQCYGESDVTSTIEVTQLLFIVYIGHSIYHLLLQKYFKSSVLIGLQPAVKLDYRFCSRKNIGKAPNV